jgi:hypothetical protein
VGSRDSIPTGSDHLVSEQGFQSGLILSFISCIFNSRASLLGLQKKKKKKKGGCRISSLFLRLPNFIVLGFVLAEISCSRGCRISLIIGFMSIAYSFDCDQISW